MVRKILSVLLWIESALIVIGSIANGSLLGDAGATAATLGTMVGTLLPVVVNILGGVFLWRFDRVCRQIYIDGFNARKSQCVRILLFVVFYGAAMFLAGIGAGASGADNYTVAFLLSALPYLVPLLIFAGMLGVYAVPYWACIKQFRLDAAALNEYISANELFYTYSEDNSVIASNKVLFFPRIFCIIPFAYIASTQFYNALEQDVIFTLTNGKKVSILANKKQYDSVVAAIEANKQ